MGKWLIGALLATTAWAPMAQAQDGRGRRGDGQQRTERQADQPRGERGWGGNRGGQRAEAQAQTQTQTRGSWRTDNRQTQVQTQTEVQAQAGAGQRREWQRQQTVREQAARDATPQQNWSARDRNGDGRADTNRRGPTESGRAGTWGRDNNGDGRIDSWGRNRRDDDRNRQNWRNDGRNDGRWDDNRGNWNRTWRQDNRYDWNRFRSSNRNLFRLPRYYAPYGWNYGYRRFSIGVALSSSLWGQSYWIDDPWSYRLPEAYGPYRWVRYYNDALLVDLNTGVVVDTVYDIFWY